MSVFELFGSGNEINRLIPETLMADDAVRQFREAELEREFRDLFVRLIPPD